jgi:hydrogenase maturation factor HypF (carbamoyltransferase family)
MNEERVKVVVRGAVQGVGFRPFVYRLASALGLRGWRGLALNKVEEESHVSGNSR